MSDDSIASHPFVAGVQQHWANEGWSNKTLLVAVSGGPDSVAVLRAIRQLGLDSQANGEIHVAHFNHGWRGEASDANEQFVVELCQQLDLPLHCQHSANPEKKEESARAERYDFLETTAGRLHAHYVLLGHNANDQAETILHRVIRGTALRGLAGIPLVRPLGNARVHRPILWARRDEVLQFLGDIQQPYCVDDSNQDVRFTRNRIRHELLPLLAERYNPAILQALLRLGEVAREVNQLVAEQIRDELPNCIAREDEQIVELNGERMLELPLHLRKQILVTLWQRQGWPEQSMGFEQWNRLIDALESGQKICCPGGVTVDASTTSVRLWRHGQ